MEVASFHRVKRIRAFSLVVLGGYAVAVAYRTGLVERVLPSGARRLLVQAVEAVKARTEPLGNAKRFAVARKHLLRVYGMAASAVVAGALGTGCFYLYPYLPIAIPLGTTLLPSMLVFFVPKKYMSLPRRALCFYVAAMSCGYSFAPVGWVAQDSVSIMVLFVGSTLVGLTVPLFLTRGMVSYVVSSELLSCSLALAIITIPVASTVNRALIPRAGRTSDTCSGQTLLRRTDVNVMLTLQLLSNIAITALHTLPTIVYVLRWDGRSSDDALLDSIDPIKEALCISAGWAYLTWRACRWVFTASLSAAMRALGVEFVGDTRTAKRGFWRGEIFTRQRVGGFGSSLLLVLFYVRLVSALQNGDALQSVESARSVVSRLSPVNLLLVR